MNQDNFPPRLSPVVSSYSWSQHPDMLSAAKNIQGVNYSDLREVGSGEIVRGESGVTAYWSSGFRHCSALIMHSSVAIGLEFAHCWPNAQEVLRPMRQNEALIPSEVAFVYGSNSPKQYELELFLAARGTILHIIDAPTGRDGSDFGVLVDNKLGIVSVLREDPNKRVFQYLPFEF